MAYMDIFDDPLAKTYHDANSKDGLPQMNRSAQHAQVQSDPDLVDMATDYGKQKAMGLADEKANSMLETGLTKGKSFFKDMFGMGQTASAAPSGAQMAGAVQQAGTAGLSPGAANAIFGQGATAATASGMPASTLASMGAEGLAAKAATSGAATGAAGAGGMAALGAAVPYIGMGLLAGKMFGLFNEGGKVDKPMYAGMGALALAEKMKEKKMMPGMLGLASTFMEEGGEVKDDLVGPLAIRKIKYKQDGGKIELEATMGD